MHNRYQIDFKRSSRHHLFYFSILQVISPPFTKTLVGIK
nr:MAG TPA: hypothetical protein [Caudoviricetes sp.]